MPPQNTQGTTPPAESTSGKKVGIAIGVLVVVAIILYVGFGMQKTNAPEAPATTTETTPVQTTPTDTTTGGTPPVDTTKATSYLYKDGTYTATGSYMSPGGADRITVSLTLKNDIITDTSATALPGDPKSARYEQMFISGYKTLIVGRNIADVKLTKVSGSSLTPAGFNDAVTQIKAQAKA